MEMRSLRSSPVFRPFWRGSRRAQRSHSTRPNEPGPGTADVAFVVILVMAAAVSKYTVTIPD